MPSCFYRVNRLCRLWKKGITILMAVLSPDYMKGEYFNVPQNILPFLFFACYWSHPLASPYVVAILGSKAPTDLQNILSCKVPTGGALNRIHIAQYVHCECWYCNDCKISDIQSSPGKRAVNANIMQDFYTKSRFFYIVSEKTTKPK